MEFIFIDEGIDAVVIDNFYSEEQLNYIYSELKTLTHSAIMKDDKDALEAAVDLDGNYITNKSGVWLDNVYNNWLYSHLMRSLSENITSDIVVKTLLSKNPLYKILYGCHRKSHLLSYYENTGYYSKHTDASVFTILNYFNTEPKCFTGGDITLHSYDGSKKSTIECKNNRVIIIAGKTQHEVSAIEMTSKKLSGEGRYCMSSFWMIADKQHLQVMQEQQRTL